MIRRISLLLILFAAVVSSAEEPKPQIHSIYRLQFVLKQLDAGKLVSTHNFEVSADSHDSRSVQIRTGNRVPIDAGNNGLQYIDVGFNCDAHLFFDEANDGWLETGWEVSTMPAASGSERLIRQWRVRSTPRVILGKQIAVGSVDDINSGQQFELDVTVTKE